MFLHCCESEPWVLIEKALGLCQLRNGEEMISLGAWEPHDRVWDLNIKYLAQGELVSRTVALSSEAQGPSCSHRINFFFFFFF